MKQFQLHINITGYDLEERGLYPPTSTISRMLHDVADRVWSSADTYELSKFQNILDWEGDVVGQFAIKEVDE